MKQHVCVFFSHNVLIGKPKRLRFETNNEIIANRIKCKFPYMSKGTPVLFVSICTCKIHADLVLTWIFKFYPFQPVSACFGYFVWLESVSVFLKSFLVFSKYRLHPRSTSPSLIIELIVTKNRATICFPQFIIPSPCFGICTASPLPPLSMQDKTKVYLWDELFTIHYFTDCSSNVFVCDFSVWI